MSVFAVQRTLVLLIARRLEIIVDRSREIDRCGGIVGFSDRSVIRIANLAIPFISEFVSRRRYGAFDATALIRMRSTIRAPAISRVGMSSTGTRAAVNNGRQHEQTLWIFNCSFRSLVVLLAGTPAEFHVRIGRGNAAGVVYIELVNLVVSVTVINGVGTVLAKGVAINHTTNVGVVVQLEVAATFATAFELFLGSSAPRCPRHMAEDHAATRNDTNVTADRNKMRLSSATSNRKAGCRAIGRRPIHDHTINNVIAAKDAADNATKERRWDTVGILRRISNSRLRIHIVDVEIAHHAAVAIGNEAAKLALVVFNLNCCRPR